MEHQLHARRRPRSDDRARQRVTRCGAALRKGTLLNAPDSPTPKHFTGTYLSHRHVCDGGDVGCSSRRRARRNMSIFRGPPTKKCALKQALVPALLHLAQGRRAMPSQALCGAPSLRVAARTARGRRSSTCAFTRRCDPEVGQARRIHRGPHARLCGRIPGNRGPCSTLRRAVCFVARLDHIDIWPATAASHPSRPGHNASRAYG
jgi:hypothetical protein